MDIYYTSKFEKSFKRLPKDIQVLAVQREKIFRENMYDARLRTHKLQWKLQKYFSFSVDYSYRIIFEVMEDNSILFINIWGHQICK